MRKQKTIIDIIKDYYGEPKTPPAPQQYLPTQLDEIDYTNYKSMKSGYTVGFWVGLLATFLGLLLSKIF